MYAPARLSREPLTCDFHERATSAPTGGDHRHASSRRIRNTQPKMRRHGSGTRGRIKRGRIKKTDLPMVAKPAPEIFRIQGTCRDASLRKTQNHNHCGFGGINWPSLWLWRDKPALLIRPGLVRPGLCCSTCARRRRPGDPEQSSEAPGSWSII